ncbi:hypothetical protein HY488_00875, partial [Candidatus Woesearchaeota archaeon]|nr:hypothetical protein [Candidatus Woesearchaeota archaeon]
VNSNHAVLKRRLHELSLAEIQDRATYLAAFFADSADKSFRKYPSKIFSLLLGEHPAAYLSAVEQLTGTFDPIKAFAAILPSLDNLEEFIQYPAHLELLQSKGFRHVQDKDLSTLVKRQTRTALSKVSDPNLLYSELGIVNFDWFSPAALEKTLETMRQPKGKNIALYFITRNPGINKGMTSPAVNDFYIFDELGAYTPIITQPATPEHMKYIINNLYDWGAQASVVLVNAHGEQHAILLSGFSGLIEYQITRDTIPVFAPSLDKILTPNAVVILDSCETGKGEDNIARDIAQTTKRRVFAPDDNTHTGMFWFNSPEEVYFGVPYNPTRHQGRALFVPPRDGVDHNGMKEKYKKVLKLTKSYYFP